MVEVITAWGSTPVFDDAAFGDVAALMMDRVASVAVLESAEARR
ncbi:hypothetical protein [Prauserella cavernicola]|nr:hypothetical protein [Prauserella cavernicola]